MSTNGFINNSNGMYDDVHIRLIFSRGNKITPYQNPKANEGPINFVIIPEHKKTNPLTYKMGINIGRVPNIRPNESILNPQYNTLSKLNCILASIEANKLGYDEGIMNDINGNISTCNSTNLFFISSFFHFFWFLTKFMNFLVDKRAHFLDFFRHMLAKLNFWCFTRKV